MSTNLVFWFIALVAITLFQVFSFGIRGKVMDKIYHLV